MIWVILYAVCGYACSVGTFIADVKKGCYYTVTLLDVIFHLLVIPLVWPFVLVVVSKDIVLWRRNSG